MTNEELWQAALGEIELSVSRPNFITWFRNTKVSACEDGGVIISVPNGFTKEWLENKYNKFILKALRNISPGIKEIRYVIGSYTPPARSRRIELPPETEEVVLNEEQLELTGLEETPANEANLNPKYVFDSFVVGSSNELAHAAAVAVALHPGEMYNPLFIYGGVGLGKTHLMQAIGQAVAQRWPSRRIVYTSSERFTNELIAAIQTKTTAKFRDRYRTVDVLLVDDIHFIAQKEATQEEFFHTFNALSDAHKQIVMSSDRSPKDIAGLEERLVSRFEWGLVTDIQPPDLETRIAILRKKAEEAQVDVPNEVTAFIAQQVTSNIRELEGALIRVIAYCNLFNKPRTAATAREVLKDMVREVNARVSLEEIQRQVAMYFHIELNELRGAKRQRSILYPRQVAMFLCRKLTEASLPEIGSAFGGRDHTTVMHAVEKIERESAQDLHKKQAIEQLRQLLLNASRGLR